MTDENDKKDKKGVADAGGARFEAEAPKSQERSKGRTLKVRRVGNSLGVVLPKEVLAKLKVGEGAELTVTDTPNGVALTASDGDAADLLKLAEDIMRKRRLVLKALAQ